MNNSKNLEITKGEKIMSCLIARLITAFVFFWLGWAMCCLLSANGSDKK